MTGSEFTGRLPFIILCLFPVFLAPAQDTITYPCAKTRRFSVGLGNDFFIQPDVRYNF